MQVWYDGKNWKKRPDSGSTWEKFELGAASNSLFGQLMFEIKQLQAELARYESTQYKSTLSANKESMTITFGGNDPPKPALPAIPAQALKRAKLPRFF